MSLRSGCLQQRRAAQLELHRSGRERNVARGRGVAQAAGQEFLHTADAREWHADVLRGRRVYAYPERNANPYNVDDPTVWLDWARLGANQDIFRFFKYMIAFRKEHGSIGRSTFWNQQNPDVQWHGVGANTDQSDSSHTLAYSLRGASLNDYDLYVMINAYWKPLPFTIQDGRAGDWRFAVDTSQPSPNDIFVPGTEPPIISLTYTVQARSIVVLLRN